MIELSIWKSGLYIIIVWAMLQSSCSSGKGNLPYHPPEFTPMYREECYSDHKNFLCMDKEKEASYTSPILYFLFINEIK